MDKRLITHRYILPEFVFVFTAVLTIYAAVCDRFEAHLIVSLISLVLSIYVWFAFQGHETRF